VTEKEPKMFSQTLIRLIALTTTDELTAKWLQQTLNESPTESAAALSETCWGRDIEATDLEQTKAFLRQFIEKEVIP
jgi:hypothetical protein